MYRLIPYVCDFLNGVDPIHRASFTQMLSLVKSGQFPLENVCKRLFLGIVQGTLSITPALCITQMKFVGSGI